MGPEVIIQLVAELRSSFSVKELCSLLGVPRSTFYRWAKKNCQNYDEVEQAIIQLCQKHKRRYGYRRVTAAIRKMFQRNINHKRVLRIMRKYKLLSLARKKKQVFHSGKESVVCPNLIQRDFQASAPNQKWFTDVTYLPFGEKMLYLSSILDGYNNEIISYRISTKPDLSLALATLEDACKKCNPKGTILHSDQGGIYTSRRFQEAAKEKGIVTSMSRKGNCLDNASIESFHSQLKVEGFYTQNLKHTSNSIVLEIVQDYIDYYNHERIQEKLGYLSPVEYRRQTAS